MTLFNRWLGTILVFLVAIFALTACGGGGGGGDVASGPAYTGATTQAVIDDPVVAEALVLDAYNGGEIGGGLSAATFSVSDQVAAGQPLVLGGIIQQTALSLNWRPGASTMEVIPSQTGPCGGNLSGEVFQNGDGTSVSGHMTYASYCSEGVILNGTLSLSGTLSSNGDITISMATSGLTTNDGIATYTLSGRVSMGFNVNQVNPPVDLTLDMLLLDGVTGKNCWVNNYQMVSTPNLSGETVTLSGRFYDFDRGFVDVSTSTPLQLDSLGIPQSGTLHFAGSNGTYADLTALGGGSYQLVVNGVVTNPSGTFQ